jgi:hypothetical protein
MRNRATLSVLWTLLSLASAFFIFADALGTAAWCGVNFAGGLYLVLSAGGFLGLFTGFFSAFSRRRVIAWITCSSSLAIATLSAIFALGFILGRTAGVPLSDPIFMGRFSAPILSLYGVAFVCCSVEAALYFPKTRKL